MSTNPDGRYVDVYSLPVPERNLPAYERQARIFGEAARRHGALSYRELVADDVQEGFATGDGEVMTAAVAEFRSRAHRDEVMAAVLADPAVVELMRGDQPADMSRMSYGGFRTLVSV